MPSMASSGTPRSRSPGSTTRGMNEMTSGFDSRWRPGRSSVSTPRPDRVVVGQHQVLRVAPLHERGDHVHACRRRPGCRTPAGGRWAAGPCRCDSPGRQPHQVVDVRGVIGVADDHPAPGRPRSARAPRPAARPCGSRASEWVRMGAPVTAWARAAASRTRSSKGVSSSSLATLMMPARTSVPSSPRLDVRGEPVGELLAWCAP